MDKSETKKKSWFRRHWILTGFLVLIILVMIGNAVNEKDTSVKNTENSQKQTNEITKNKIITKQ